MRILSAVRQRPRFTDFQTVFEKATGKFFDVIEKRQSSFGIYKTTADKGIAPFSFFQKSVEGSCMLKICGESCITSEIKSSYFARRLSLDK